MSATDTPREKFNVGSLLRWSEALEKEGNSIGHSLVQYAKSWASEVESTRCSPVVGEAIDMLLFCPKCGMQHVDEAEETTTDEDRWPIWENPPHRSHKCHGCGCIWRPADVATNGVKSINTCGKADSWLPIALAASPAKPPEDAIPTQAHGYGTPEYSELRSSAAPAPREQKSDERKCDSCGLTPYPEWPVEDDRCPGHHEYGDCDGTLVATSPPSGGVQPSDPLFVKIERDRVWIERGVQSFMLAYDDTDNLEWYAARLRDVLFPNAATKGAASGAPSPLPKATPGNGGWCEMCGVTHEGPHATRPMSDKGGA